MRRLALLLLPLLFAGCATPLLGPGCTPFGRDGQLCLLPPAALPPLEGSHMVKVTHDGQEDAFLGLLHIDSRKLELAGFSLFGTSLFDLTYDGTTVTSVPVDSKLKPEMLVAMLELSLADPKLLQGRLHGLTLKTASDGNLEERDVYEGDELIVHLQRDLKPLDQATLSIEIPPRGIKVEVTPLPADKPAP
ncbi:MAG TPA: DUF3261 domain-containing protein [Gammaproteobacteria bacterium]|nr:DUF3261 domain-containing protein [Gammaproteobacteria bacterium]